MELEITHHACVGVSSLFRIMHILFVYLEMLHKKVGVSFFIL